VPVLAGEEARLLKFTGAQLNFVSNNSTWLVRVQVPGMKNLNTGIKNLYGRLSVRQNFVRGLRPAQTALHTNF